MSYHHATDHPEGTKCQSCQKTIKMYWRDKEELNGRSETLWNHNGLQVCHDCITNLTGRPPKTLQDLNEERRMIDVTKLEDVHIGNIDTKDYPDFCDAYLEEATIDGRELTQEEYDWVNDHERQWVYDMTIKQLF